jgi:hypothetical protein
MGFRRMEINVQPARKQFHYHLSDVCWFLQSVLFFERMTPPVLNTIIPELQVH